MNIDNKKLYNKIKKIADKKFKTPTSIYKSSWIVSTYKKLGGSYSGKKPKNTGLTRWYKEKWVDLNRPIKNYKGQIIDYHKCGRKSIKNDKYPLCRPTYRITKNTPKTYKEIPSKNIENAKKLKKIIKGSGNVKFFP